MDLSNETFGRLPVNPCVYLSFESDETFGVPLADQRFCQSSYSEASKVLSFNISFDGQGWNIKYRVYPNAANTSVFTLVLSIPEFSITRSVDLEVPTDPTFELFCQVIENDKYSAKVRGNG